MTREEEIKERVDTCGVYYVYDGSVVGTGEAEDDLRYLLARNEELQRRVNTLTDAAKCCLPHIRSRVAYYGDTEAGEDYRPYKDAKADYVALLNALDAKEQDDASNDS